MSVQRAVLAAHRSGSGHALSQRRAKTAMIVRATAQRHRAATQKIAQVLHCMTQLSYCARLFFLDMYNNCDVFLRIEKYVIATSYFKNHPTQNPMNSDLTYTKTQEVI